MLCSVMFEAGKRKKPSASVKFRKCSVFTENCMYELLSVLKSAKSTGLKCYSVLSLKIELGRIVIGALQISTGVLIHQQ